MSLVYSTDQGRLCPQCEKPVKACACAKTGARPAGDGSVRLQRQTQGRAGKAVTVITGIALEEAPLKALAKALKQRCGCGGSVKDGAIEIQGDHRALLKAELEARGYRVKMSGG